MNMFLNTIHDMIYTRNRSDLQVRLLFADTLQEVGKDVLVSVLLFYIFGMLRFRGESWSNINMEFRKLRDAQMYSKKMGCVT